MEKAWVYASGEEQIFERANREVIKIKRPTTKKKKSKYDLNLIEGAEEDDSW